MSTELSQFVGPDSAYRSLAVDLMLRDVPEEEEEDEEEDDEEEDDDTAEDDGDSDGYSE